MLRKVETGEFPVDSLGEYVIGKRRNVNMRETSKVNPRNRSTPFTSINWSNSLESRGISFANPSVGAIQSSGTFSDIAPSIVEGVMVYMVSLFSFFCLTTENKGMHRNCFSFGAKRPSECIETFWILDYKPVTFRESFKIFGINNGVLPLRERDKFYRLVQRLNNFVTFHAVFHRSTSNGLLKFSRNFSIRYA